jgi:hypothetical protein
MRAIRLIGLSLLALSAPAFADDFLDRVDEALTTSAFHDDVRARLSGLVDLEIFQVDQPPLGLIDTDRHFLFNPRLSLFLDSQFGSSVYLFVQSRIDRGFDPSDSGAQIRLDEYALRITPWDDGRFNLQVGKFSTVIGNWIGRHLSWDNPFITAPLPYENLTAVSDVSAPIPYSYFMPGPGSRYENNPLIWGPSYATGASVAGRVGKFDYAAEIKNASLSSRPESWDATRIGLDHPVFSGRIGFRPDQSWNFGFSASNGPYFRPEAVPTFPSGRGLDDYRQLLLGQDISWARHHWQVWAEFYEVRFQVPHLGNADTFAYYIEGKYKFNPQLFAALRWNQQLFATLRDRMATGFSWAHDVWQVDAALGYRFTAHTQLKVQYSLQDADSAAQDIGQTFAAQLTVRF